HLRCTHKHTSNYSTVMERCPILVSSPIRSADVEARTGGIARDAFASRVAEIARPKDPAPPGEGRDRDGEDDRGLGTHVPPSIVGGHRPHLDANVSGQARVSTRPLLETRSPEEYPFLLHSRI